jgi:hypothetical protein
MAKEWITSQLKTVTARPERPNQIQNQVKMRRRITPTPNPKPNRLQRPCLNICLTCHIDLPKQSYWLPRPISGSE